MPYASGRPTVLDDDDFAEFIQDKAEKEAESVYNTFKEADDPAADDFCERSFKLGYVLSAGRMMDSMAEMIGITEGRKTND